MKNIIIYVFIFILGFIGTTVAIISYNNKFVSLFELDFRMKSDVEAAIADSIATYIADSLAATDSLININNEKLQQANLKNDLTSTQGELNKVEQKLSSKDKEIEKLKAQMETNQSEKHKEWLKATIKIYEAMESNKAAQLLANIPEKEAREIIYSMKKKKAAEILSSLNTETVKKLTRAIK